MTKTQISENILKLATVLDTFDISTCGLQEYKTLIKYFVTLNSSYYTKSGQAHNCFDKQHNYMRNLRKVMFK